MVSLGLGRAASALRVTLIGRLSLISITPSAESTQRRAWSAGPEHDDNDGHGDALQKAQRYFGEPLAIEIYGPPKQLSLSPPFLP
jgi:hypothetical protein